MFKKLLSTCLFLVSALVIFIYIVPSKQSEILSPLVPGRIAANLWLPKNGDSTFEKAPEISAESAYFVDINTGQVLYQKNPDQKLPIASLTKIMTAIVTLENRSLSDQILISEKVSKMEPDSMLLLAGEKLTVEELLEGVFLVSANDAAQALAETTFDNYDKFISEMNNTAIRLGLKNTLFVNPTGLEEDNRQQYSTAFDVALMSRYAIKTFSHLIDITKQPHILIPKTETHQDYDLYSGINLLTTYPGVIGFKTGFTPGAGLTLVTLAQKDGHQVLGVLLHSENRREEARELLDYSFKKLGI
ncbi:D-alanyl-D-alanine carboxypeptidase [Candidatus Daviesbacteria bacterium]|nr:D-alanyl-D-alanine carboxypeptidase [Candidatus Daviesbacteria bacterium]